MQLYPAIDLLAGKSVRLTQGDYQRVSLSADPLDQVARLNAAGLTRLHLVDLDGARAQQPINQAAIKTIRQHTSAFIELGGGIRNLATMNEYLTAGIDRLVLGSVAITDPEMVEQAIAQFGSRRIVVGIDVRSGKVATNGWLTTTRQNGVDVMQTMQTAGVHTVIVTDIGRDGTMQGPNVDLLRTLQHTIPEINIVASGGVRTLADLTALRTAGIHAAIIGKAWQTGAIDLNKLKELEDDDADQTNYSMP
ncbi:MULTISPECIES: 1-(5-phosphoribosyl)-5-[(5-phosphoribosylamino)methylideneamino]imidazole-4-carboxamide isomerase [Lacticaseibacillus]|uniref:1-(5-phosphoribosyl)-5-[(5-phosphoribosylamino)methylideneamino] imidazole-4-carboxamide isomerase n=2 Tax=Lacticaseibacillus TaxID=2759736 RepID=A0AAN1C8G2_LACCA|nr:MULTISPECIES: 1-(5-phosphoribosyl)-5-[(5-phosphoribosylamino)methylideneamino]imidazole-4-carboxamide isomerase [Lacticaseibacillus]ARY91511.1 1-(5-phosphoribosyl)-5-[(5-phosphoribosylamino)methylideneamino]imidazole-4-carboxamide isomerase [Lacticaseibacillus casei]KAB1968624.1 1-(5-phosphoribosyl)-5-[(5-phosphoribosylamino)methylideneamino]imidazole-4-carboxamide isomerase [Lacticaseibacillus casei]WLV82132.1 1-(5-phosphoribosyl)-5-[(5-phosphoribosylamino)methylideneamino]imidazole-4-carbox